MRSAIRGSLSSSFAYSGRANLAMLKFPYARAVGNTMECTPSAARKPSNTLSACLPDTISNHIAQIERNHEEVIGGHSHEP